MTEFGRVSERRQLRVNEGEVFRGMLIKCGRMYARLNGDPLKEVDCFKYLGSQVAADGGCESNIIHRMNGGFKAWGAIKGVICN